MIIKSTESARRAMGLTGGKLKPIPAARLKGSHLETSFAETWHRLYPHLPLTAQHQFSPPRRWRFDYCWPVAKVAVELDGGIWNQGRHSRGAGIISDSEKCNRAIELGWVVFRIPTGKQTDPAWLAQIAGVIEERSKA